MKLQSDDFKKELQRYYSQLEFLEKNKNEWVGESYSLTKTFYNEKIKEYHSKISKTHPEWLLEFDTSRANEITVIEGNEITPKGIKVLG
ncbi:hypothetical protein [Tenacibaculum halocynthiae]|uniref:hypothetical protein n=1 Tax=Tenacibaculum halocynthiae TaxID=1254437 RepID=UPI003D64F740